MYITVLLKLAFIEGLIIGNLLKIKLDFSEIIRGDGNITKYRITLKYYCTFKHAQ